MKQLLFTQEGYKKIKKEYDDLITSRPDAVEHLRRAREMGDLSENGYYKASRSKLSFIDSRLRHLKKILEKALVVTASQSEKVTFGTTVTISDGKQNRSYKIVNGFESDPAENKISDISPIGKELMNKKVGDTIEVNTPRGKIIYKITNITI